MAYECSDDVLGWYRCEDASGDLTDECNSYDFSPMNTPTYHEGGFWSYAVGLDGTSDYFELGDTDVFSFGDGTTDVPFSISAWINMTDASNFAIIGRYETGNREWLFYVDGSDRLSLRLYDESGDDYIGRRDSTALTANQGQWMHVMATYDGSILADGIDLYINNTLVDDTNVNLGPYVAMENLNVNTSIGKYTTSYAHGYIDEVVIFRNHVLESIERYNLFHHNNLTAPPPSPSSPYCNIDGIISWYTFDTGFVVDSCGSTPDGTNYGAEVAATSMWGYGFDFEKSESDRLRIMGNDNHTFGAGEPFSIRATYVRESNDATNDGIISLFPMYYQYELKETTTDVAQFIVWDYDASNNCIATSAGVMATGVMYDLVGTWDGISNCSLYINGTLNASTISAVSPTAGGERFTSVGYRSGGTTPYADGVIDEVVIAGEAWDAITISNMHSYNHPWNATSMPSFLRDPRVTPSPARVGDDLNCTWIAVDSNSGSINANITWYVDGTQNTSWDVTALSCGNNTLCGTSSKVTAGVAKNKDYICSVVLYDGVSNSGWQNSTAREIDNTRPSITLNSPSSGSTPGAPVTLNVTVTDADGDASNVTFVSNFSAKEDWEDVTLSWTVNYASRWPKVSSYGMAQLGGFGNYSFGYPYNDGHSVAAGELAWYIEKEFTPFKPVWLNFTHYVRRGYFYKLTVTYDNESTETIDQCVIEGDPGSCSNNYYPVWTLENKSFNLTNELSNYGGRLIKKLRIAAHRLTGGDRYHGGMYIDNIILGGADVCKNLTVSSGSSVTCAWSGLSEGSLYTWNVIASDGESLAASSEWNFTAGGAGNNPPTIDDVKINGQDAPSVNPTEAGTTIVTVEFNVTDSDGAGEIDLASAYANDTTDSIANTSCAWSDYAAGNTKEIKCELSLAYSIAGGAKTVEVYVEDTSDAGAMNDTHGFTYNTIYVISINVSELAFGSIDNGSTNNAAALFINNTGNGALNISVKGSDFNSSGNILQIGNCTVDDDPTADEGVETDKNELTLTTGAQDYTPSGGVAALGNETWWFFLDVPAAQPAGPYSSVSDWEVTSSQAA